MSVPTYDKEEATQMMLEDRADERKRDYYDALQAAAEQEPVLCDDCGQPIADEPVEDGSALLHHHCNAQRENVNHLQHAAYEYSEKLAHAVEDYNWERTFGSALHAVEQPADALFRKRMGYLAHAMNPLADREVTLTSVKLILYSLLDEAKAAQPANAAHAATAKTREQMLLGNALQALEQL